MFVSGVTELPPRDFENSPIEIQLSAVNMDSSTQLARAYGFTPQLTAYESPIVTLEPGSLWRPETLNIDPNAPLEHDLYWFTVIATSPNVVPSAVFSFTNPDGEFMPFASFWPGDFAVLHETTRFERPRPVATAG